MEGDTLISRELLQEHLDVLIVACSMRMSTMVDFKQGSWEEEFTEALQKPFTGIE